MSDPTTDYARAATDLDGHVDNCPQCLSGRGCADGDDIAEREYRTWRALNPAPERRRAGR